MAAIGNRVRPLFRQTPHQFLHRLFSSSLINHQEDRGTGSSVYRHILKTQRPPTIMWQKELDNCVSFIGRVYYPIKTLIRRDGLLCAYTHLKLDSQNSFIKILIDMWGDMAELSIRHLKPNDHIYVSGYLRSFKQACDNGSIVVKQKVIVKEINYVANNQKTKNIEDERESDLERERKRLYLWQVFFANPYEWRDLRKCKVNPRQPDFKHKGTGESLWLNPHDPPWVMRQLRLQDSRLGERGLFTTRSNLTKFTYNDI